MELIVQPDGIIRCLYDEQIDLSALGLLQIRRASFVEPDSLGRWQVDLAPCRGPRLGPFMQRSAALAAERVWIESAGIPL